MLTYEKPEESYLTTKQNLNQTALHLAAIKGVPEIMNWLIESKADIEAADVVSRTNTPDSYRIFTQ